MHLRTTRRTKRVLTATATSVASATLLLGFLAPVAGAAAPATAHPGRHAAVQPGLLPALNGTGTLNPAVSSQGQGTPSLAVQYTANPADANTWVCLVPKGQPCNSTNYNRTAWNWARSASGTASLDTSTLPVGNYDIYLVNGLQSDNSYTVWAGPSSLAVTPPTGTVSIPTSVIVQGTKPTSVQYTASPANSRNWICTVPKGQTCTPSSYDRTAWDWATAASGTRSIDTGSLAPGDYDVYLVNGLQSDNTYTLVGGPSRLTVLPQGQTVPMADPAIAGGTLALGLGAFYLIRRRSNATSADR
ncbi:hypothetical protein [Kitasatospora sp. MMS16-BH015]|uniref:hypothetical protein n=1 Tax=Kitasatospora sp. MMS16-BH015 TaxID=2018025 RepID=UPI000CF2E8F9|nr:hypothetical protein [Kitasatospora sp. MMS16-BH015]